MNTPSTNNQHSIAMFIDIENLICTASAIGLPTDITPINERLLHYGRISVRRSFGDLDSVCRSDWRLKLDVRRMLHENLVQIEDVPYINRHKNTSDIRLAVEAMSVAYTHNEIDHFAIVSSDRDYHPLISKLRELGKTIIGIGVSPDTVNPIYVKACDVFIYYSTLFTHSNNSMSTDSTEAEIADIEVYIQLLCQSIRILDSQGIKTVGSQIVPLMRQLKPDYELSLIGLNSIRDLVELATKRGLVASKPSGADITVYLTNSASGITTIQTASQPIDFDDIQLATSTYRNYFESKLKCEIPSLSVRNSIYQAMLEVIPKQGQQQEHHLLSEISNRIVENTRKLGASPIASQQVVFKLLYSLFRGGAFFATPTDQPYNPRIEGLRCQPTDVDNIYITNCIRVMAKEKRWPLRDRALSDIFEVDLEMTHSIINGFQDNQELFS